VKLLEGYLAELTSTAQPPTLKHDLSVTSTASGAAFENSLFHVKRK